MPSANEIRQQFIDFFVKKHGHTFVRSSPVVPLDDPTLLFTNAGMNQFKDVFLGTGSREYKRAVDTQKCIRAGGKHNDLDDVGKDTYHHTFFEMLGNWSFGDYFKKEAITWAWELLTREWKLDKSRLHATVFEGDKSQGLEPDQEAFELWMSVTDIDPTHIHWGNKKDNFWEMGETGPCGPCSEIHYDRTPDKSGGKLVNAGSADVIEIWNNVFIQFNRGADRKLTPLPAKHVDTGMGFERITSVLQGKSSNYDTDIFTPIFEAIQKLTGKRAYGGKLDDHIDTAYRVIGDHIRALVFAITDGAMPSNEKRGYVVRNILRRAFRFGYQYLDRLGPFLHDLVPIVVDVMGGTFPELKENAGRVRKIIREEEESFLQTLDRGFKRFELAAVEATAECIRKKPENTEVKVTKSFGFPPELTFLASGTPVRQPYGVDEQKEFIRRYCAETPVISGKVAYDLHTEQGLFVDILEQIAAELGLKVDRAGYEQLYLAHRQTSGKDRTKHSVTAIRGEVPKTDDSDKYHATPIQATVLGWIKEHSVYREGVVPAGEVVGLLVDRTNFYAEQGGQVGDEGSIDWPDGRFLVEDTQRLGDAVLHFGKYAYGALAVGQAVLLNVQENRLDTMRNHTATHLLNWALRKVLGEHIEQKGSLVDAEKTRFDFSHTGPLSADEVAEVERLVNERIYADVPVTPTTMPLADAKKIPGVRAVFGEKYPDPVRVLLIGPDSPQNASPNDSVEFCGGTHLRHTGEAGFFKIVSQESVAKGVRRVTAVTGREAVHAVQKLAGVVDQLLERFRCKPEELLTRVDALDQEIKKLQQQLKKGAAGDLGGAADKLFAESVEVNGARVIVGEVPAGGEDQVRQQLDRLRQKAGSAVVLLGWADDGKVQLIAAVTDDLVKKGVHAGKLVGAVAKVVGGGGGGKPNMAQAGGKEPEKLSEALALGKKLASEQLAG